MENQTGCTTTVDEMQAVRSQAIRANAIKKTGYCPSQQQNKALSS
jgi:hypothetical protein